jgi:predicted dehydrogenase
MTREAAVRYVYDLNPEMSRKAAEETGADAVADPRAIFDAKNIDIVTLATPPFARLEYVRQACEAGKHLMLEKPMARTLDDALGIFTAIRQSGVKCFMPFARTTNPACQKLAELIGSGELGDPLVFIHTDLAGPYPWVPLDHWMNDMQKSGGPIGDYSVHFIELARACMSSEADNVFYSGKPTTGRIKSDDQATLMIEYRSGGIGEFTKSWAFPPGLKLGYQKTHVICREAIVEVGWNKLTIHSSRGTRQSAIEEIPVRRTEGYRNLISAIEKDTPLIASELEGLRTIEILDAALTSRRTGCKEHVNLSFADG